MKYILQHNNIVRFQWDISDMPKIIRANRYFLNDSKFSTTYCAPSHALHMYDYDCEMIIDGKKVNISRGDITLSPSGIKTSYNLAEGGGWHYCTHFYPSGKNSGNRKNSLFTLPLHIPSNNDYGADEKRFQELIALFTMAGNSSLASFGASNSLLQFLIWLSLKDSNIVNGLTGTKAIENKLKSIENYININLEKAISIHKLASRYNISQNYLAQMFRKKNSMTIQHYILILRIDKSKYLLAGSNMSIKEIGVQVGLPDPQHFNKTFRKATGQSPTDFRMRNWRISPV